MVVEDVAPFAAGLGEHQLHAGCGVKRRTFQKFGERSPADLAAASASAASWGRWRTRCCMAAMVVPSSVADSDESSAAASTAACARFVAASCKCLARITGLPEPERQRPRWLLILARPKPARTPALRAIGGSGVRSANRGWEIWSLFDALRVGTTRAPVREPNHHVSTQASPAATDAALRPIAPACTQRQNKLPGFMTTPGEEDLSAGWRGPSRFRPRGRAGSRTRPATTPWPDGGRQPETRASGNVEPGRAGDGW